MLKLHFFVSCKSLEHGIKLHLHRLVMTTNDGDFMVKSKQFVNSHLSRANGVLDGENNVVSDLNELTDEGQVLGILGDGQRPI